MEEENGAPDVGSTRYPFVSLSKALKRAKQLYDAAEDRGVLIADAFTTWGYSSKSSGGFQTVAALKMYGLAADEGGGDQRRVALSTDALRYFRDERPEPREQLIRKFALTPTFLAILWEMWGEKLPADHIARSQLKVDLGLTEQNTRAVMGIYLENLEFAKLKGHGKVVKEHPPLKQEGGGTANQTKIIRESIELADDERELTTGLLAKDASFRLIVTGRIGPKELDRLIAKLQLDRDILAEPEPDQSKE